MADVVRVLPWGRDEAELVAELQSGSDAAYDWLVTHYNGPVYSLLYGMLGKSADAADCAQEVFLKAFRGIRGFHRGSTLKTWLYRIAIREALNHKRWHWRHSRQQVSLEGEREENSSFVEPRDQGASPFDWMASRELRAVVQEALQKVPKAYRAAVILRDLDGLSYEEVGEVLDVSVGTVKSRMIRGRRLLREILEPVLHGHGDQFARHSAEANVASKAVGQVEQVAKDHGADVHGLSGWTPQGRGITGFSAGGGK
ncbi:MAG: sigma-70 family RNA polymerase sigma factor [Candidatus Acidiferrales bacterium]